MKKNEVKVGKYYTAKVTGHMATVRIDAENPKGGWAATNLTTGKKIRIKTTQRLRSETRAPDKRKETNSLAESDTKMAREQASAERAAQQVRKDIAETVEAVQDGDLTKGITVPTRAKKIKKATKTAKVHAKPNTGEPVANGAKRTSGLAAAATILADATEPLNTKEMVTQMLASGIWSTNGKTPAATIYAAIIRHIATKGDAARFRKADRGKFELNI